MSKTRELLVVRIRMFMEQYQQIKEDGYNEIENWTPQQDFEFLRGMLHMGRQLEEFDNVEYRICYKMICEFSRVSRERFGF